MLLDLSRVIGVIKGVHDVSQDLLGHSSFTLNKPILASRDNEFWMIYFFLDQFESTSLLAIKLSRAIPQKVFYVYITYIYIFIEMMFDGGLFIADSLLSPTTALGMLITTKPLIAVTTKLTEFCGFNHD